MNILVVGSGAREHVITKALHKSATKAQLYCFGTSLNPCIDSFCGSYEVGNLTDVDAVVNKAKSWQIELAWLGPEAPLAAGLVDALRAEGIHCVGPSQSLARIESSKAFTRDLLKNHHISDSPVYQRFQSMQGVESFLNQLGGGAYVIKADGLMGGKGVKVAGDHLHSFEEALAYCHSLVQQGSPFVIEEKLIGQEFSCHCFTDGETYIPMPLVQDNKRAFVGDKGPNTGGMGSFSDANHSLPFLSESDVRAAHEMNQKVIDALSSVCGEPYRGVLYGSYIATRKGIACIEYNARLGDPESLNMLSIIDTDFVALSHAIATGQLAQVPVSFASLATVCKYAVPEGYPDNPVKNTPIDLTRVSADAQLYLASVDQKEGQLIACGSRTVAAVGVAKTVAEAEQKAELAIGQIDGALFHRPDIGTYALLEQRINMMRDLREPEAVL